jgi:membrane-associated HD superfamily phosphohydrolase
MMSTATMLVLIAIYAVIVVFAVLERNWWRVLYFVGAIVISVAVLGMTAKRGIED